VAKGKRVSSRFSFSVYFSFTAKAKYESSYDNGKLILLCRQAVRILRSLYNEKKKIQETHSYRILLEKEFFVM
jgi:hypothetical protein